MTWQERYRRGSFRGVEFFTEASDLTGGRRTLVNEYPYKEDHYTDDLGKKAPSYSIEGYIANADYFNRRDSFIKACNDPEVGELIHPYYDEKPLKVICSSFSISERSTEGGMFKFSATFVEKGTLFYPKKIIKPSSLIKNSVTNVYNTAKETYVNSIYVNSVPDFVRGGAQSVFKKLGDNLKKVLDAGTLVNSSLGGFSQDTFNSSTLLRTNVLSLSNIDLPLVSDSLSLVGLVQNTFDLIGNLAPNNKKKREAFKKTRQNLPNEALNPVTDSNRQYNDNISTAKSFIEVVSVVKETEAAITEEYETYDDAISARNYLAEEIDKILETTKSDALYDSMQSLKTVLHESVPDSTKKLPQIKTIELTQGLPSLVISHLIYGTRERADEIVRRNKERHPAFIQAKSLEVLVDE